MATLREQRDSFGISEGFPAHRRFKPIINGLTVTPGGYVTRGPIPTRASPANNFMQMTP